MYVVLFNLLLDSSATNTNQLVIHTFISDTDI